MGARCGHHSDVKRSVAGLQLTSALMVEVGHRTTPHLILGNLSAHMGPEVTRWLDQPKRERWHLHFTPTSSSWLNLVE